jgi:hypothetical protein
MAASAALAWHIMRIQSTSHQTEAGQVSRQTHLYLESNRALSQGLVAQVEAFIGGIPAPLGIGTVILANGHRVKGFICEKMAEDGAEDISGFGGWRNYLANR